MKFKLVALVAVAMLVSACNPDPQAAHDRRQVLMAKVFPNPADRKGLHLVFPVSSSLEIIYFPGQVSQSTVDRRASEYCARIGHPETKIQRAPEASKSTLANGTQVASVTVWYDCD
jgi:hypothetical protein